MAVGATVVRWLASSLIPHVDGKMIFLVTGRTETLVTIICCMNYGVICAAFKMT